MSDEQKELSLQVSIDDRELLKLKESSQITSPLTVALDIKKELEEYKKSGDRQELVNVLRDQFLLKRHETAARSEEARYSAIEMLIAKMPDMSENMLLRVIDTLAKVGEIDVQAIAGILPGGKGPLFAFNQIIGGQPPSQPALQSKSPSNGNPVQNTGLVLEALEHLSSYLKMKTIDGVVVEDQDK
jgi:hypothetical protein